LKWYVAITAFQYRCPFTSKEEYDKGRGSGPRRQQKALLLGVGKEILEHYTLVFPLKL